MANFEPSFQRQFSQAQRLYKQGQLQDAKKILRDIKEKLEKSRDSNPIWWNKLIQAANEILAIEMIWLSFQVSKGKTITVAEMLKKIEAAPA